MAIVKAVSKADKERKKVEDVLDGILVYDQKNEIENEIRRNLDNKIKLWEDEINKRELTEDEKKEKLAETKKSLAAIIQEVQQRIIGQDSAIKTIAHNIFTNQRIIQSGDKDSIDQKVNIFLDGPTGTGKTAILKSLADLIDIPIVIAPSTAYSSVGYEGASITEILAKLLDKAGGDLNRAQTGIICLDEFDKLGAYGDEDKLSIKNAVQEELLTFIGGSKYDVEYKGKTYEFDTSKITFIALGAFTRLREAKIEEQERKIAEGTETERTYTITKDDYINIAGLSRELVGRFKLFTATKAYTVEDYINIQAKSKVSPLKEFVKTLRNLGVENVTFDDNIIQTAAQMAYEKNTGARGLQEIYQELRDLLLEDVNINNVTNIHITADMLAKTKVKEVKTY